MKEEPLLKINIPRARFLYSVNDLKSMPENDLPEYCILGRSNVGKSSFLNHLFADRNLARVSKTPGKTILANFFQVGESMRWVDLPGYGYTRRAGDENDRITSLIHDYCTQRTVLRGIIWLLDIRHPGLDADMQAREWLSDGGMPVLPVLTKSDKMSRSQAMQQVRIFEKQFSFQKPDLFSILTQECREIFWNDFLSWSSQP
jgi:GTP-binding protein